VTFDPRTVPIVPHPDGSEAERAISALAQALDRGPVTLRFDSKGGATVLVMRTERPTGKHGWRTYQREGVVMRATSSMCMVDEVAHKLTRMLLSLGDLQG